MCVAFMAGFVGWVWIRERPSPAESCWFGVVLYGTMCVPVTFTGRWFWLRWRWPSRCVCVASLYRALSGLLWVGVCMCGLHRLLFQVWKSIIDWLVCVCGLSRLEVW